MHARAPNPRRRRAAPASAARCPAPPHLSPPPGPSASTGPPRWPPRRCRPAPPRPRTQSPAPRPAPAGEGSRQRAGWVRAVLASWHSSADTPTQLSSVGGKPGTAGPAASVRRTSQPGREWGLRASAWRRAQRRSLGVLARQSQASWCRWGGVRARGVWRGARSGRPVCGRAAPAPAGEPAGRRAASRQGGGGRRQQSRGGPHRPPQPAHLEHRLPRVLGHKRLQRACRRQRPVWVGRRQAGGAMRRPPAVEQRHSRARAGL